MTLLIAIPTQKPDAWVRAFKRLTPEFEIRVWPESGNPAEIDFIVAWETPPGFFRRFPNLKCIASLGAGIDHLLSDPELPGGVFITRVVDPSITRQMSEYVLLHVLRFSRHSQRFDQDAAQEIWRPRIPLLPGDLTVGIMGLGQLGLDAAHKLKQLDFPVIGWRRTRPKLVEDVADVVYFLTQGSISSFGTVSDFIDKFGNIEDAYFNEEK